jgi:putative tricarboxylic transport membrane protein
VECREQVISGRVRPVAFTVVVAASTALAGAVACTRGAAGAYPNAPVDLVVPFQPGGGSDNLARSIQDIITRDRLVPQPVTVSNRSGGSGAVGIAYVASRPQDSYTLVTITDALLSLALQPGYKGPSIRDLRLLAVLALDDELIVVPAASRFKTIQDVIAEARAHPRALTLATEANGGGDHILGGLIEMAAGVSFSYVHTRGGAEAMQHVTGGHVDLAGPNPSECLSQVRGGLVRALAVSSPERLPLFPDVPTLKESGIDVEFRMFRGIAMPKNASPDAIAFWEGVLKQVTSSERWRTQYLERFALTPYFRTGSDAGDFVERLDRVNRQTLQHLGVAGSTN